MSKQYIKIKVGSQQDIRWVKSLLAKNDIIILTLESVCPAANNRVIRYAQYFEKKRWKKIDIKLITRFRKSRSGTQELHIISVMLKRTSCEASAEGMGKSLSLKTMGGNGKRGEPTMYIKPEFTTLTESEKMETYNDWVDQCCMLPEVVIVVAVGVGIVTVT
jgi:hypothetical protein